MSRGEPWVTWTCDRCGKQAVMQNRDQPRKWIGVQFVTPPLRDMDAVTRRHLCDDCDKAFADFMYPGEASSTREAVKAGQRRANLGPSPCGDPTCQCPDPCDSMDCECPE